ncbi:MAG: hypothetical protein OHK0038_02980 [Flammeovirgaceae bacterium]
MNYNRPRNREEKKKNFFQHLSEYRFDFAFDENVAVKYLPHFIFVTFLGILYIANSYYSERIIAQTVELQQELDSIKVDYSTMKYEFIYASKPAEISEKVKQLGLEESEQPAYKIEVESDFYEEK